MPTGAKLVETDYRPGFGSGENVLTGRDSPRKMVGMAGFEPAILCSQGRWVKPLPYIPKNKRPGVFRPGPGILYSSESSYGSSRAILLAVTATRGCVPSGMVVPAGIALPNWTL